MIVLDTNVVSEGFRPRPNNAVLNWIDAQSEGNMYLCAPVVAELRYGVERLATGRNQNDLRRAVENIVEGLFQGRILPFDSAASIAYARVMVRREQIGRRIAQMDAMIAAIALTQGATLASRDTRDFADIGLELVNPFDAPAA
jgi:predicted nucleic acid-binding protein